VRRRSGHTEREKRRTKKRERLKEPKNANPAHPKNPHSQIKLATQNSETPPHLNLTSSHHTSSHLPILPTSIHPLHSDPPALHHRHRPTQPASSGDERVERRILEQS